MAQDSKTVPSSSRRSRIKQTSATLIRWILNILSFCYINKEKKQTRSGVRHKSNVVAQDSKTRETFPFVTRLGPFSRVESNVDESNVDESNVNESNVDVMAGLFLNIFRKGLDQEREDSRPRMNAAWITDLPGEIIDVTRLYWESREMLESQLIGFWNFCKRNPPEPEQVKPICLMFHRQCREKFTDYLGGVVKSLREMDDDESMLRELVGRWFNHKVMFWYLSQFYNCLNPMSIPLPPVQPLNKVGVSCFLNQVYQEFSGKASDAVISLINQEREGEQINQEREGEQIDRALLKNVLDISVEIGLGLEYYQRDFEKSMLENTTLYYSCNASSWILGYSFPDYMLKAEECLKREKDRVKHYLHSSSEPKLLEIVRRELLTVYATELLQNERSGCHALLRDDKVDDLSRMYRLFSEIPKELDLVSSMFKQHATDELTTLMKNAADAASNKKAEKIDVAGLQEQVSELLDKYHGYVKNCFNNDTLFQKALQGIKIS